MKFESNKEYMEISPYIPPTLKNFGVLVEENWTKKYLGHAMNFDLTLICHKLLVNFVSLRDIFMAQRTWN